MSKLIKRYLYHYYTRLFLAGAAIMLIFSSWGKSPDYLSIKKLAGEAAFTKSVSWHSIKINDSNLLYQAAAGYTTIGDTNSRAAQIFYTAYTTGNTGRPVTFVFNGGPGSSSIWLHMGSIAPVRATSGQAGYSDNTNTWLQFTDLVFIDPVGTGFSRPADGTSAKRYYGYHEDIGVIAQFIQKYLAENKRTNSPLFLAGESYGAARAVGLSAYLHNSFQINVAGLTLISPALNYRLITFGNGNDTPYPYYLPGYAAAAQFHRRLTAKLQAITPAQLNARVTQFAFGSYRKALANRGALSSAILDTLSYYTGLNKALLRSLNGRVSDIRFTGLLLKTINSEKIGTYDSRDTGSDITTDPSERRLRAIFPQAFATYLQRGLRYENKLPYLATIATPKWNYGPEGAKGYLDVVPILQTLLRQNPELRVQIVGGDYDLATPAATVKAVVAQLPEGRVSAHYYQAGHMLYTDDRANAEWRNDSQRFYNSIIN